MILSYKEDKVLVSKNAAKISGLIRRLELNDSENFILDVSNKVNSDSWHFVKNYFLLYSDYDDENYITLNGLNFFDYLELINWSKSETHRKKEYELFLSITHDNSLIERLTDILRILDYLEMENALKKVLALISFLYRRTNNFT